RIVGAIVISTVAILVYAEWRVPALARSHSVIYIDALLTAALVLTARLSFRSLEELRKSLQVAGERVLIYGAGDGGELVLRGPWPRGGAPSWSNWISTSTPSPRSSSPPPGRPLRIP